MNGVFWKPKEEILDEKLTKAEANIRKWTTPEDDLLYDSMRMDLMRPFKEPRWTPETQETPWYKKALGTISKGFEWLHEEVETPWASIITAPFSPQLPARPGESWLEREKREYEKWQAPRFVKGIAEFSTPIWWLPYFGWSARAAGFLPKIGGSLSKGIIAAEKAISYPIAKPLQLAGKGATKIIKLPTFETLRANVFKQDRFRQLAQRLSVLPGFKSAMGVINPSAMASGLAQEGKIIHSGLREMSDNAVNAIMPQITRHPDPIKLFGIDDLTRVSNVTPKKEGLSMAWADIASNPTEYNLNALQKAYLDDYGSLIDNAVKYAEEAGVEISKREFAEGMRYIPRRVEGKLGLLEPETGMFRPIGTANEAEKWISTTIKLGAGVGRGIGGKPFFERPRIYDLAEEAIQNGIIYGQNPNITLDVFLKGIYKLISDKTVADVLKPLGKTVKELTPMAVRENVANSATYLRALRHTESALQRASRGERLPGATLASIRRILPNIADRLQGKVAPKYGIVGKRATEYDIATIDNQIANINKILTTKGRIPPEMGTKPQLRLERAELEARREVAEICNSAIEDAEMLPEWINTAIGEIETELSLRGMPYHGGVSQNLFPDYTASHLDVMRNVYAEFLGMLNRKEIGIGAIKQAATYPTKEEFKTLVRSVKAMQPTAKANYWSAVGERKRAYELARRTPGFRSVGQPFAAGRLFPNEIADDLTKMLVDRGLPVFDKLSDINAMSRFLVTGFDFGAAMIQGVPLMMGNPVKWGRAFVGSIKAFANPTTRARYLTQPENIAVMEKLVPEGLLIGDSEFMEAAQAGLLRTKAVQTVDRLNLIQRFSTSFNQFGDCARIEWAKALLPIAEREGWNLREMTSFLNEATGVISSRALGIGATQRQIEGSMLLFAPRYFRANMALWTDMVRGGLRGKLARDSLVSMLMGGYFFYYGLSKSLGQEPNLDPSSGKFMTVEIGGQHVGLGSMQVAGMRLLGNIWRTATEDPGGFIKLDSRDNPLVRFIRSRVSQTSGAAWDIITGKTFVGEALDKPVPFMEEVVARRVLPFWLSGMITDYPRPGIAGPPAEVLGARTWPLQLWEQRDELRHRLAMAEFNKPWYSTKESKGINELQKRQLEEKYEDLKTVTEAATQMRLERGGVEDELWNAWREDRNRARGTYESKLWAAQKLFDAEKINTGYEFKKLAQKAGHELRGAYKNIESNPAYSDIYEYLNQPMTEEQLKGTPVEDIAFDEWVALMYSGDLEDEAGQYNFDEAERRRQVFIAQWGGAIYDYVQQRLKQGKDLPPLMIMYLRAQEALKPYWAVAEDVEKTMGKEFVQTPRGQRVIAKLRRTERIKNPEIDKYYSIFYKR